jgi:hypothetical protein
LVKPKTKHDNAPMQKRIIGRFFNKDNSMIHPNGSQQSIKFVSRRFIALAGIFLQSLEIEKADKIARVFN